MTYYEFTFTTRPATDEVHDVLSAVLAEVGFDSFVRPGQLDTPSLPGSADPEAPEFAPATPDERLVAYVPAQALDEEALRAALEAFPLPGVDIDYTRAEAEDRDWNAEWEKHYFQPIVIGGRCVVAGTFHHDLPAAEHVVRINPQMSFGTGHHATTAQMATRLLDDGAAGCAVLDMGCGTGILAILARMLGASSCRAIDVDEWCVRNTLENMALNAVDGIDVELGDASVLPAEPTFDVVLANINRNVLTSDMGRYAACLKAGGCLYMSGFFTADVPVVRAAAEAAGLAFVDERSQDGWACVKCAKPAAS